MLTLSGTEAGHASQETIDYYSARSQAASLMITEYHYVSRNGGPCSAPGFPQQLAVYDDDYLPSIRAIAQALKQDGNQAVLQIHHGGREAALRAYAGKEVVAPSAIDYSFLDYPVRALTEDEIWQIIKDFGAATLRAIEAGFDGIEIHGANHYLIQQFFSQTSNHREDDWGGSLKKRMRFAIEVIKEVKRVVAHHGPETFIIGYRISPQEIHGDTIGYTYHEALQLVATLSQYELDYFSLSLGIPYDHKLDGQDKSMGQLFKEVLDEKTLLLIVGGVFDESSAQEAVEQHTDLIGVGRGTLIDPQFDQKILAGQGEAIISEISPQQLKKTAWTSGLLEDYTRPGGIGLPVLPNNESIYQHPNTLTN